MSPDEGFIPLVAPMEGFRLRKIQARRCWRRARTVTAGVVLYLTVVLLGLWGLVLFRLA